MTEANNRPDTVRSLSGRKADTPKIIIDDKIPFARECLDLIADRMEAVYLPPSMIDSAAVKDADALVVRTRTGCGPGLLEGSSVGMVATATIGTDHIDLPWCRENGIKVTNAAGCNAPGVAQYVWSSLLRLGFDPSRHTIGIVGYGNVGSIVAEWGRAMGARVLICDPPRQEAGCRDVEYVGLETVLRDSDAVTIHTPLTRTGAHPTFHMIGERELSSLRPDAVLVNSSRGPVVDGRAWLRHLGKARTHAVIDVWEGEPDIDRELLMAADIATPHIAGYSYEGKQRATRMALKAVEDFFSTAIPTETLCGDYKAPAGGFPADTADRILDSYDPFADTRRLRARPEDFERLRAEYDYRHEPSFT